MPAAMTELVPKINPENTAATDVVIRFFFALEIHLNKIILST